jgi:hypothetical protein
MTSVSEWVRLARTANLIDNAIVLDSIWTRQLAGPISEQDRPDLIELGVQLANLVRDIAGSLDRVDAWANEDAAGLGAAVDRALEFAESALGMEVAAELRLDYPPAEWARIVLRATAAIREETSDETQTLERKVERILAGESEVGDLGLRVLRACHVIKAAIECAAPAALLAGVTLSPATGAMLLIAAAVAGLAVALQETTPTQEPTPTNAAPTVQQIVDQNAELKRREGEIREWLVDHRGLTHVEARHWVARWRIEASLGRVVFDQDYGASGRTWIVAQIR